MGACVGKPKAFQISIISTPTICLLKRQQSLKNSNLSRNMIKNLISQYTNKNQTMLRPIKSLYESLIAIQHLQITQIDMNQLELFIQDIYQLRQILGYFIYLQKFNMMNCRMNDSNFYRLGPSFNYFSCLRYLNLRGNLLTAKSVQYLVSILRKFKLLQYLDLSHNMIGDKGVAVLCKSFYALQSLEELVLDRNQITSEGFRAVCQELGTCGMKVVRMRYNFVKDFSLRQNYRLIQQAGVLVDLSGNYQTLMNIYIEGVIV